MSRHSWLGGRLYIQNLACALASLPEEERRSIRLSVAVRSSQSEAAKAIQPYVDGIYTDCFFNLAKFELYKLLADRISWIPLERLNPRDYDFVYPEVAGRRAPYAWGGWIPDFQYRYLPGLFSAKKIARFNAVRHRVADAAPVVVLSSKMAQDDFKRFYPHAGAKSRVMNFASYIEPEWFQLYPKITQEKYRLPEEFFLVSNQFWKHKDHAVVIEALGILKRSGIHPVVACTGGLPERSSSAYYDQLIQRIEELGLENQVRLLGLIPRIEQIQLMRSCLAVIQPSLFEGWSTVVEDARALGKPILISDFPVHLEQNPPDSYFFERGNHEQLALLITTAFSELKPGPDLEKEMFAREENSKRLLAFGRQFLEIVRTVV